MLIPATNYHYKILIVEDNFVNRKVLSKQLELLGYQSFSVVNGQLAVDYLTDHQVDCVLMDCQMPVMDGYEATTLVREQEGRTGHRTVIIGLTAYAQEEDLNKCLEVGMDDYLEKPAFSGDLQKILAKWLPRSPHDHGSHPQSDAENESVTNPVTGDRTSAYQQVQMCLEVC